MLDFTSAMYLSMEHPHASLRPWARLTTGRPAALEPPPRSDTVAAELANLQGCEAALLGPSTVHLFGDLFRVLERWRGTQVYLDDGSYPIAHWGVERAAGLGVRVQRFRHHDPDDLRRVAEQRGMRGRRPVVVADGFCPSCGRIAPLAAYRRFVRARGGFLVIDDTQALGIFGSEVIDRPPYGTGGGGSLRATGIEGDELVTVSSLAKAFGVPLAVLAGSASLVRRFANESELRVHASPPSAAAIAAAEHALELNRWRGDVLRSCLADRVRFLRTELASRGIASTGGDFPVQALSLGRGVDAESLHKRLLRDGVRTVLHSARLGQAACISLLLTALHRLGDLARAALRIRETLELWRAGARSLQVRS